MVKPDKDSIALTVLNKDYSLSYQNGNLQFELRGVGEIGPKFGYYTLLVGNGVGNSWPQLEYKFLIRVKNDESIPSSLSSDESNGLGLPAIIGMAVGAAVCVILVAIVIVYYLKLKQTKKALERNQLSNFDMPLEPATYIYPNFGFDAQQVEYNKTEYPPPYNAEENPYVTPNEYMEIGPHAVGRP